MDYQRIRRARKAANLTQVQLAQILGVNRATISKYENGEISPPIEQLESMAQAFGIPVSFLLESEIVIIPDRLKIVEVDDPSAENISFTIEASDEEALAFGLQIFARAGVGPEYVAHERLTAAFDMLNTAGRIKAVERVEELTEIPKYKK